MHLLLGYSVDHINKFILNLSFKGMANPYKNEKVAAMLLLGCGYLAAIRYICDNWWRQSS